LKEVRQIHTIQPWLMTAFLGELDMTQLPETGFLRLRQIIGDPNSKPPSPPLIPVKKSCWWQGIKTGRFPKPIKLGPRITVWRVEDIRDLIMNAWSGGQNVR
jgi:prophage regulatory protein